MDAPIRRHKHDGCDTEGCNEPHYGGGMCIRHYKPARAADGYHDNGLRAKYGLEPEDRQAILAVQEGVCAICLTEPAEGKVLVVDHDHAHCRPGSGCIHCVRGMLCTRCNVRLGMLEDWKWVEGAIAYLKEPPAYSVLERRPWGKPEKPFSDAVALLKELGLR